MKYLILLFTITTVVAKMNQVIKLDSYPDDQLTVDNFRIETIELPSEENLKDGEVILEVHGLSVDPYMRGRVREGGVKNYFAPGFNLNEPIQSSSLCKVIASKSNDYKVGDFVSAFLPWQKYQVFNVSNAAAVSLTKPPPVPDVALYYKFLFPFNIAPLSAWLPVREFWKPETLETEKLTAYVSGAAGAVGMVVGQILKKVYGFGKVIGSAGSDEKVQYLVNELGFDDAFNYKKESPYDALPRLAPNKIDYFFDNVGGQTFDAVLENMSYGGKVIACGTISTYDKNDQYVPMKNMFQIVILGLTIQGYLLFQFADKFDIGKWKTNCYRIECNCSLYNFIN
jgi:hypothetical protein